MSSLTDVHPENIEAATLGVCPSIGDVLRNPYNYQLSCIDPGDQRTLSATGSVSIYMIRLTSDYSDSLLAPKRVFGPAGRGRYGALTEAPSWRRSPGLAQPPADSAGRSPPEGPAIA